MITAATLDARALFVVLFFFGWIVPSIVLVPTVVRARGGGWTWIVWALVSLVCSPLLTLLALAAIPPRPSDVEDRFPCPYCAEAIKAAAMLCPHCRSDLQKAEVRGLWPR